VVDTGKKLADVAFEYPGCAGVVFGYLIGKMPKLVHCSVRALSYAAGIGVRYKRTVKVRIQDSIYGMVQKPISNRGFVYIAGFWVGNFEVLVPAVAVSQTY